MAKVSAYFMLDKLDGQHDKKAIKRELDALPGVLSVSVSQDDGRVAVDFDSTGVQAGRIAQKLEEMGCQVLDCNTDEHIM